MSWGRAAAVLFAVAIASCADGLSRTDEDSSTTTLVGSTGETTSVEPSRVSPLLPDLSPLDPALQCDPYRQAECPAGYKCAALPADADADARARCVPVGGRQQPGESCTREGDFFGGLDDCEAGAMCFWVDPETLEGECFEMCTGDVDFPLCSSSTHQCVSFASGLVDLCFETCDPVLGACPEGQGCYAEASAFVCAGAIDDRGIGEACGHLNECMPGLACIDEALLSGCDSNFSFSCCSPFCDLTDPTADASCQAVDPVTVCRPWFPDGAAPAAYAHVGVCSRPA